jgi:hypothetical protein
MKVVLLKINWFSPKQAVIGLFSWSNYCHAALLFNGERCIYDASESRGDVNWGKSLVELGKQKIVVYDIPDDETPYREYALKKLGTKYDWKGISGWIPFLPSNDPKTVYCFELVLQTLILAADGLNGKKINKIAWDLKDKLFKKPIDSEDIFILLERAELDPVYEGTAKHYK